ncbi:MAG: hypothetical protein ACXWZG_08445, partial [Microbacterium sp.]
MTPDRTDQTHADDAEHEQHGVLSDTGSVDTTGIGFLGGQTEQVSVVLPSHSEDDDLADDDVVDDEVTYSSAFADDGYIEPTSEDLGDDPEHPVTGEIE